MRKGSGMKVNFHRRIGLKPGIGFIVERFSGGVVYGFRFGWSLLSLTKV